MYNKKSDYALNKKNKEAIISRNAKGEFIKLTKEEFASEEEFKKWKEWSDDEYRQEYNAEQSHKRLKNKLQKQAEYEVVSLSVEQILLNDLADEERKALVNKIKSVLTEKQFRRLWLYYVEGKTEQQIADIENVGQPRIVKSISSAKKRVQKYLGNFANRG